MLIRRIAVTLGLLAFAVTLLGGAVTDSSLEFTVTRALWALLAFCGLGAGVGWAADRVVREHRARQYENVFGYPEGAAPETGAAPAGGQPGSAAEEVVDAFPAKP